MPGRMHDACVFRNSPLFRALKDRRNQLLHEEHIIADSAYKLMYNVMTPFRDNGHLPEHHTRYNIKLSGIRSIIEQAFGLLKIKFRRLRYLDISDPEFGNIIIAAGCMLHNFIIDNGEIPNYNEVNPEINDNNLAINDYEGNECRDRLRVVEAIEKRFAIAAAL